MKKNGPCGVAWAAGTSALMTFSSVQPYPSHSPFPSLKSNLAALITLNLIPNSPSRVFTTHQLRGKSQAGWHGWLDPVTQEVLSQTAV
ncbi:uncharacterized [Tachysurus ichikawai]